MEEKEQLLLTPISQVEKNKSQVRIMKMYFFLDTEGD